VYFSNLIVGRASAFDSAPVFAAADFAGDFFGGAVFVASWPKTGIAAMATNNQNFRKQLRSEKLILILLNRSTHPR
jgi:hypothetical protein